MPDKFDFRQRIGAGHFGEVWRCIETGLNAERAVKFIHPSKVLNPKNFFQEAQILKAVEHPNIVRVVEAGTHTDGRIYVAMELLSNGSLEDERKGSYVGLTRAKRLMIDVLRGLQHAHSKNVLHRDIKPGNILIGRNGEGQLSDFGLAIPVGMDLKSLGARDAAYFLHQAPECLSGTPYGVAADIYACGVTLYRIVNGDDHFVPPNQDVRKLIASGRFPDRDAYRAFVPLSLRNLINTALEPDPKRRFQTADDMRRALEKTVAVRDWLEERIPNGKRWSSDLTGKKVVVTVMRTSSGRCDVIVQKGPTNGQLRRVNSLSLPNTTTHKGIRRAARILQDLVLGKIN